MALRRIHLLQISFGKLIEKRLHTTSQFPSPEYRGLSFASQTNKHTNKSTNRPFNLVLDCSFLNLSNLRLFLSESLWPSLSLLHLSQSPFVLHKDEVLYFVSVNVKNFWSSLNIKLLFWCLLRSNSNPGRTVLCLRRPSTPKVWQKYQGRRINIRNPSWYPTFTGASSLYDFGLSGPEVRVQTGTLKPVNDWYTENRLVSTREYRPREYTLYLVKPSVPHNTLKLVYYVGLLTYTHGYLYVCVCNIRVKYMGQKKFTWELIESFSPIPSIIIGIQ